ncbi:tuliposide A-converting enzyme 2, chloroplastic-like isoform X1 [Prosopis cineraria]|uniref:tuliposide A-converting enzyme 2, chloroplastic-like isoform X1 n=1 Tax=Prosopis cineraria TaxID=364024 RepID=UPI00240F39DA|nr:tuliposide A-converting enzyme 2, chloroplastic-like isoform X1 [Prosopis cineraria]
MQTPKDDRCWGLRRRGEPETPKPDLRETQAPSMDPHSTTDMTKSSAASIPASVPTKTAASNTSWGKHQPCRQRSTQRNHHQPQNRLIRLKAQGTADKLPLLIYINGGAFCICSMFHPFYQGHLNTIAAEANAVVLSINYRLAPEAGANTFVLLEEVHSLGEVKTKE